MSGIHILVTLPQNAVFDTFFDSAAKAALEEAGAVQWNELGRQYTPAELRERLRDVDICVTGWGTAAFDGEVLSGANRLGLIAHTGGSVKPYVTDEVYERGIRVVCGNEVFAESVAEGAVAYALASLRQIPMHAGNLAKGVWPESFRNRGLLDRSVGLVGYGMVARHLVDMLRTFHCPIKVYSRHIGAQELERTGMVQASLEEIFSTCDVVSLHSGMTPENHHMITESLLERMKPGALLLNTARGALIDEEALCRVLAKRPDLSAALDVYETEPLPAGHPLEQLENVLLMPHMGGPTVDRRLAVTRSVTEDIRRFLAGQALSCEISRSYAAKMSAY